MNPSSSILHVKLGRQTEQQGRRRQPHETVPSDTSHRYSACLNMPAFKVQPGKQHLSKAPGSTFPLPLSAEKNPSGLQSGSYHILHLSRLADNQAFAHTLYNKNPKPKQAVGEERWGEKVQRPGHGGREASGRLGNQEQGYRG